MRIDLTAAKDVVPEPAPLTVVDGIDLKSATLVSPSSNGVIDPLADAGITLTKMVLGMVSGAILLLLALAGYQEIRFDVERAELRDLPYAVSSPFKPIVAALNSIEVSSVNEQLREKIRSAAQQLRTIKTEGQGSAPAATLDDLEGDLNSLANTPPGKPLNIGSLREVSSRMETLDRQDQADRAVQEIKNRADLVKTYGEEASAARDFWSKSAQMILLNLLLPVLTALLGYVFGSKHRG